MIASIIRFADEISDDFNRADRVPLQAGTLPEESVIFHKYSFCLKTAEYIAESKIISYEFRVEEEDLKRTFPKKNKNKRTKQVYLIEEIYQRTMKTFLELVFCSKFFRPHIQIERVRVEIKVKLDEKSKHGKNVIKTIQYDIDDLGYPSIDFKALCPEIAKLTGAVLAQKLTDKQFEDVKYRS